MLSFFDILFGPAPSLPQISTSPVILDRYVLLQDWKLRHIDAVAAACRYDDEPVIASALRRFKYGRSTRLATTFSPFLDACIEKLGPQWKEATLCPVPLHWRRFLARGFNQTSLLSVPLGRRRGLPVQRLLWRARSTGSQAKRGGEDRRIALTDAFVPCRRCPRTVILVDDILTTGATVDACASALRQAGAERVAAIAVALG